MGTEGGKHDEWWQKEDSQLPPAEAMVQGEGVEEVDFVTRNDQLSHKKEKKDGRKKKKDAKEKTKVRRMSLMPQRANPGSHARMARRASVVRRAQRRHLPKANQQGQQWLGQRHRAKGAS